MEMTSLISASTSGTWIIPDNTPEGVSSPILMNLRLVVESLKVHVDITHPFIGDLQVNLIAPSGKAVTLHSREGFSSDNIVTTYEGGVLEEMRGEGLNGEWQLQAIDFATRDSGTINSWSLEATYTLENNSTSASVAEDVVTEETAPIEVEEMVLVTAVAATETEADGDAEEDQQEADEETEESDEDEETEQEEEIDDEVEEDDDEEEDNIAPDNLKEIEGIGPKIEALLNAAGITTYDELAETSVERLQEILNEGGPAYNRHNPATWAQQAQMAGNGDWDELRAWQDELIGGRVADAE
jgi:subtilisin-like proprotein convertase family protein